MPSDERQSAPQAPLPCCATFANTGEHTDSCRTPIYAKIAKDRAERQQTFEDERDGAAHYCPTCAVECPAFDQGAEAERARIVAIIDYLDGEWSETRDFAASQVRAVLESIRKRIG